MPIIYDFLPPSHPLLNKRVEAVAQEDILSEEVQKNIEDLLATAESYRQDPSSGILVGLAAPQVGIAKRIIIVDVNIQRNNKDKGILKVYLNPEIVFHSETKENDQEDCYSVHSCLFGVVSRSSKILVRAYNRFGLPIEEEFIGYSARIVQHEIDHLDGIRFPDKIGPYGKLHWVHQEEFDAYLHQWPTWPCPCPWNIWLAIKEGRIYSFQFKCTH